MLSKSIIITLNAESEVSNVQFVLVNVPDDVLDTPTIITTDAGEYQLVKVTFGTKIPDFNKFTIDDFKQIAINKEYHLPGVKTTTPPVASFKPTQPVADVTTLEDVKPKETK